MSAATSKPYQWLKVFEPELVKLQDLTSTGGPDAFSWEGLNHRLGERLERHDLIIQPTTTSWHSQSELASFLGRRPWVLNYTLAAVPGKASLVFAKEDVAILMAALLTGAPQSLNYSDEDYQRGFFRFLGVVISHTLGEMGFNGDYALSPTESNDAPQGPAMCLDISVTICGSTVLARLVATEELVKAWKERFSGKSRLSQLNGALAQSIDVILHLEVGHVALTLDQFRSLHTGDFVLLDSCSIRPGEEKGRVLITTRGIPIFRGMLKPDKVKILEFPVYYKVDSAMDNDDEGVEHGSAAETQSAQERLASLPVNVVVEAGRIKMTLEKLLQLQPGELLELEVKPEESVDLVVNGQCIGHGELLRLGEALGVRVLELG